MPELPDILAYLTALETRLSGQPLEAIRIQTPFLLRSLTPAPGDLLSRRVERLQPVGKRIAIGLSDEYWLIFHLMIAGRLHWRLPAAKLAGRQNLAAFDFPNGSLVLTEAGTKRRASLHLARGADALAHFDPGGIDVLRADLAAFQTALSLENHTLKRALTDPRLVSGIGNAYSDEILHAARLSPIAQTHKLKSEEWRRLHIAAQTTLHHWIAKLQAEARQAFPEKVTAFRPDMAVHGRYGEACRVCGNKILRIRYADNETNYCAYCQTGGKVLADRGLSRLLGADWPRTLEDLETQTKRR